MSAELQFLRIPLAGILATVFLAMARMRRRR